MACSYFCSFASLFLEFSQRNLKHSVLLNSPTFSFWWDAHLKACHSVFPFAVTFIQHGYSGILLRAGSLICRLLFKIPEFAAVLVEFYRSALFSRNKSLTDINISAGCVGRKDIRSLMSLSSRMAVSVGFTVIFPLIKHIRMGCTHLVTENNSRSSS